MRFAENFFRFCNAMYLGMMLEKASLIDLSVMDIVMTTLNIVTLISWIIVDIFRTKQEVQE